MIPFRNLFQLFVGDFLAKILYFVAFVYLARVLGVAGYGVLEFSLSVLTYFLVLADGGLELWATRESARGKSIEELAGRVVPLRLLMAAVAFGVLLALLPLFPDYPQLRPVLTLFGLTLFAQGASLKWAFMGRERLGWVASGLVVAQVVFSLAVFAFVRDLEDLIWVPILRLVGDLSMAIYFAWFFFRRRGRNKLAFTIRGVRRILVPALTMGASHGLAYMSYNFDAVLIGFMKGSDAVGWYGAAYKPITAALAIPVTYFIGLFPTLSRTFAGDRTAFRGIVSRSFRLATILAFPIGVGGTFLAEPIIHFLFGSAYTNSILPLKILSWTAVLVIMRGTFRQSLNAANRQDLDLRCASTAVGLNVCLNLILIPQYGITGAAVTTLVAEILWISMAARYFHHHVEPLRAIAFIWQPIVAAIVMSAYLFLAQPLFWIIQGVTGPLIYFGVLLLLGETEVHSWLMQFRLRLSHDKGR